MTGGDVVKLGEFAEIKTGLVLARKRPISDTVAKYNPLSRLLMT